MPQHEAKPKKKSTLDKEGRKQASKHVCEDERMRLGKRPSTGSERMYMAAKLSLSLFSLSLDIMRDDLECH